jgi:hydrogenase-4 membrane subunit HyfE
MANKINIDSLLPDGNGSVLSAFLFLPVIPLIVGLGISKLLDPLLDSFLVDHF